MVKLRTLCTNYLEEHFFDLSESTRETTERAFKYLILSVGNLPAGKLKASHLQQYKRWLIAEQMLKKSAGSVMLRAVLPVLRWAIREGELLSDPTKHVADFKFARKVPYIYSDGQVAALLAVSRIRLRVMVMLARYCGLRRSEVLNLHRENIRNGYVYVEPKEMTASTWEWHPKCYQVRSVPILDEIVKAIRSLPGVYPLLPAATCSRMLRSQKKGWLKERERNCPVWNFNRDYRDLQLKAFGERVGDFHDLRATFCTAGLEAGVPLHVMKRLMGHSNIRTTLTYYTVCRQSALDDAGRILAEAYKNRGPRHGRDPVKLRTRMGDTRFERVTSCV